MYSFYTFSNLLLPSFHSLVYCVLLLLSLNLDHYYYQNQNSLRFKFGGGSAVEACTCLAPSEPLYCKTDFFLMAQILSK